MTEKAKDAGDKIWRRAILILQAGGYRLPRDSVRESLHIRTDRAALWEAEERTPGRIRAEPGQAGERDPGSPGRQFPGDLKRRGCF